MKTSNIGLSNNDKITLISNFSTMFSAGIPIFETVDSLLDGAKGSQKKILETLRDDLIQGTHVSTSFAKFPKVFNKVTVHIIQASEEAGTLDVTLKDIKEDIKKDVEFQDRIKGALTYPILIVIVFMGVLLVMLVFVIPRISSIFSKLKVNLPLPTRVLIFVSDIIVTNTIPAIIFLIVLVAGLIFMYKTKRRLMIEMFSHLPVVSTLAKNIDLKQFARSLNLLLTSGIPITAALELSQAVVVRREIANAIGNCKNVVLSGRKLSDGFKTSKNVFPAIMIKLTEAGEKSGSLDKTMAEISEHLDYQVSTSLRTVTVLIEPLMLVVVGILIGGMMLAIIAPIYGLIGQVSPR